MEDLKGIAALFTACITLSVLVNLLIFYKDRKSLVDGFILAALVFVNQSLEFVSSFWAIDKTILVFAYINTFNFSISFASYYLLKRIQPESKQNWKAFMFSIMLLPAGFVYMASFKMVYTGFFFTQYRYFASPLANVIIGLLQALWGLYFLTKVMFSDEEKKKSFHYKAVLAGYLIPPVVVVAATIISLNSALLFESVYSKLLILNVISLFIFIIKDKK